MTCVRLLSIAISLLALTYGDGTHATTYYIDSTAGNDANTGLLPNSASSIGTEGPWQSLNRVGQVVLAPGDQVRLKCGQRWPETLRLGQSGTAIAPILVGSYPAGCSVKPVIDGASNIPGHNWTAVGGGVYRTSLPVNLLPNGKLNQTIGRWSQWSAAGNAQMTFSAACPASVSGCLMFKSATSPWSLVASPTFPLSGRLNHRVRFSVFAPTGTRLTAVVRRGGPTFENLGLNQSLTGSGAWQQVVMPFVPGVSSTNARFDLYVGDTGTTVWLRDVAVETVSTTPSHLIAGDRTLQPAHHPNRGFDAANPESVYLRNSVDSNVVAHASGTGSTYLTTGSDLALPAGATLTPGLGATLRTANWMLDRRRITSVSGGRLQLDSATSYPFGANWGYYLTGAVWMVDSPDEWFYDVGTGALTVRMPDSQPPGDRVDIGQRAIGIDLSGLGNIVVEGLAIRGTTTGVSLTNASNIRLSQLRIENVADDAIDAMGSMNSRIEYSTIQRTGGDAIAGRGVGQFDSVNLSVEGNTMTDVGVQRVDGTVVSLPSPSRAAINMGINTSVTGNRIDGTNYIGIRSFVGGIIRNNYMAQVMLVLNDGAGIYLDATGSGSTITGNLVDGVTGSLLGTSGTASHAVGIYLDEGAADNILQNNTVCFSDYGIQVHDGHDNLIENNTIFGTRRQAFWLQEHTNLGRAEGDVYRNVVARNVFFSTNGTHSVVHTSFVGSTTDFASYIDNVYFALMYPNIVSETWPGGSVFYTFSEWQAATTNGVSRGLDTGGRALTSLGYAAFKVVSANVVPNGDIAAGRLGWGYWNQTAPFAQLFEEASPVGPSLRIVAGSTPTLLTSPNFAVHKDQWYRVSFDAKVGAAGQLTYVTAKSIGGGTVMNESLMGAPFTFRGNTQWTRYSFTFKSSKSVSTPDPVTGGPGARLDFGRMQPGEVLSIANVEMVALATVGTSVVTAILTNPSTTSTSDLPCPDAATNAALCSQYVRFSDNAPIVWPYPLPALGKEIIYTRDATLLDMDKDGVADSQDSCSATASGAAVKSNGCAIGQVPK